MIVATDIAEVHEIMADTYRQHVMIVSETQMHVAPWLHAEEGWQESRLRWAVEAVCAGQVRDLGLAYEVQGDTARYTIPKGAMHRCPCPAAHYGPSQHCKHRVALELYRRVLQAYPDDVPSPVDDQTLPLALGPVSVEERLAQTPHVPQEDRMTEDPDAYIPEPGGAPVAVLEPPASGTTAATPRPLPPPVVLPSLDARTLELSMQAWSAQRQVVKRFLQQELVEGTDYYTLRIKGRETKPALSKAGSEKFLALFQLHAVFDQDTATWTMLGQPQGTLCYRCQLYTRSGEMVGEGRGARTVQQDGGDINKAVKMAQKCLGGTTPILIRSARGISRTLLNKIHPERHAHLWIAGPHGTWRKIVRFEAQPVGPVRRLLFRDGLQVTASLDHRWPLVDGRLVETAHVRVGDCVQRSVLPTGDGHADADFLWMAGLFVAEGWLMQDNGLRFSLHAKEEAFTVRLQQIAERLGAHCSLAIEGNKQTVGLSGPAPVGLMEHFVEGRLSYGKHFTGFLFRQDAKGLLSALSGYLDGDGSYTERPGRQPYWKLGFTRKNHQLAHDLRALCAMLGYRCRIGLGTAAIRKLGKIFDTYNGWIKQEEPRYNGQDLGMIMDIGEGEEMTYELEVDGDHLFCLANGLVTHNSSCVDAILRTGALSDVFTQDLDEQAAPAAAARPSSAELRSQIWAIVKAQSPDCDTRARVEAWIKAQTGYDLHPDHYQAILTRLQEVRS